MGQDQEDQRWNLNQVIEHLGACYVPVQSTSGRHHFFKGFYYCHLVGRNGLAGSGDEVGEFERHLEEGSINKIWWIKKRVET